MIVRKQKGFSQSKPGKQIITSGNVIGRHESGVITPSVEVIMKIADKPEVSTDFLVGITNREPDKSTMSRLEDIVTLFKDKKAHAFKVLDALLRDYKTQRTYS